MVLRPKLREVLKSRVGGGGAIRAKKPDAPTRRDQPEEPSVHNVDSLLWTTSGLNMGSGFWSNVHPGTPVLRPLTYPWFREKCGLTIPAAWISVRTNQVADFVRHSQGPNTPGVVVRLKDTNAPMTPAAQRRAFELAQVILRGGGPWGFGSAEMETRALVRDSLTFDQANAEVIFTRAGKPWGWIAADAATIRRAKPTGSQMASGRYYPDEDEFSTVQINATGSIVEQFTPDAMMFLVRRPRTDQAVYGYGWPEMAEYYAGIESLINLEVTNDVAITTGVHAASIVVLMSKMDKKVFRMTKEALTAQLIGTRNNRKTPIIQLDPSGHEEIKVVPLGSHDTHDMEFGKWLDYRIQGFCAIAGIDRSELGIMYEANGPRSSLSTSGPEERNIASQERGLRPLLRGLAAAWTHWLIEPNDPDFCADFTGLGVMSDQERIKNALDMAQKLKSVNEVRATFDLPPLDSERADYPLDQAFTQEWQTRQAMAQPQDEYPAGEPGEVMESPAESGIPDDEPPTDDVLESGGVAKGGIRGMADALTRRLVASADAAVADGRFVRRRLGSGGRKVIVDAKPNASGVKAWLVEV